MTRQLEDQLREIEPGMASAMRLLRLILILGWLGLFVTVGTLVFTWQWLHAGITSLLVPPLLACANAIRKVLVEPAARRIVAKSSRDQTASSRDQTAGGAV